MVKKENIKKRNYKDAYLWPWPIRRNFLEEIKLGQEIEEWCKENFNGYFTAANPGIYVYEETDLIALKIVWNEAYKTR